MSAADRRDATSGVDTTGHEWDGIRELNNPLPKWWLYIFYASIAWAVVYWIVMPAWPLASTYTKGLLGYSQREAVLADRDEALAERAAHGAPLLKVTPEQISKDSGLLEFALANGKAAFGDNCAGCHGAGGGGARGFPNLQDDDWLHGGSIDEILRTIRVGVRSTSPETLGGVSMPAFGRDGSLKRDEIENVAAFVRTLSSLAPAPTADVAAGGRIFATRCASCHGAKGEGNREMGAPRLNDAIWLYGSDQKAIVETLATGRAGVMPAWESKLDEATLRSLAVYVRSLGGAQ
ncbi:cytochrome-c oxidase, cbb3-type subunit III [Hansschlegelia zhihuaiae]|uniref:Cbb3-type cytochrome c oxidase subunit n=1 Tax=Hansschlegelia zhihuaiae TaxID=405005 RepID=A0A4Q0MI87_9HYPH|nr:cytochrome-c oxidase, cbb3-type subunit III [Hansschlegelia zhihuaiae]RXF73184.1 cytochrome-c oxidase, cbb3-type subunit III [Hansschlegelia zhihuaiae]